VRYCCRYAYNVLELEELNRRLEEQLSMVQVYSKELSRSQGIDVDSSQLIKDTCDSDAKALFERRTAELNYTVQSPQIAELITRLTAMLLQLKVSAISRSTPTFISHSGYYGGFIKLICGSCFYG